MSKQIIDDESEFSNVNELIGGLSRCYQIQVDDKDLCSPVYLGNYADVPMPVHKIIRYKNYNLHVVTYILTEDEIKNKLFKLVGVNVFKQDKKNSLCSLDLIFDTVTETYQLIFNDHRDNITTLVEKLEKFPGKDNILSYVINKSFEEPLKSIIIK